MHRVGLLGGMIIAWAVLTGLWVLFLIYRSVHMSHEANQLFLSQSDEGLAQEHQEAIHQEKRVNPFVYTFGAASIVLLVSIVSVWIWQGLGI
jgi:hypothetical protein